MSSRSERLLRLLQALRGHRRPVTAKALSETFGVSERTVYRDLQMLKNLGAPVEGEAGVGFVLGEGYFLPPLTLTQLEADALLLGLRFVQRRGDDGLIRAATGALAKIASCLGEERARAMRTNGLTVGPSQVGPSQVGDARWIARVRQCIADERKLRLSYCDGTGVLSERIVWPIALAFFDEVEILVAWCELREAFRHFRLDRFRALEPLADRLPAPRRILLAEYRLEEPDAEL